MIHHVLFSEMKATCSKNFDRRMFPRDANPYNSIHRKTWARNFLKSLEASRTSNDEQPYVASFVGFDLSDPNIMYLMLSPPPPALAALASYNMETRAVKLVPKVWCLLSSDHIFVLL